MGDNTLPLRSTIMTYTGKWMKLDNTILNKVNQAQNSKYHMFFLNCGLQSSDFCGCGLVQFMKQKGDHKRGKEEPYREEVGG